MAGADQLDEVRLLTRGQLRIALNNGVTPEEIVETFIQVEAYAGAARAFAGTSRFSNGMVLPF